MEIDHLSDEQYGLLFDVRRSARYHDRRSGFFTKMHQLTGVLTVLLAGSVIFDIARPGDSPFWLLALATLGAGLAAIDFVVGYATRATTHRELKNRWLDLEMAMIDGDLTEQTWHAYRLERLRIEKDEPPVYRALDLLCHNELLVADAHCTTGDQSPLRWKLNFLQRSTSQLYRWPNVTAC